jgi:hypothetical protein
VLGGARPQQKLDRRQVQPPGDAFKIGASARPLLPGDARERQHVIGGEDAHALLD